MVEDLRKLAKSLTEAGFSQSAKDVYKAADIVQTNEWVLTSTGIMPPECSTVLIQLSKGNLGISGDVYDTFDIS